MAQGEASADLALNLEAQRVLLGNTPLHVGSTCLQFKLFLFLAFRRKTMPPASSYVSAQDMVALPDFRRGKSANQRYLRKYVFDLKKKNNDVFASVFEKTIDGPLQIRLRHDPACIRIFERHGEEATPDIVANFLEVSRPLDCTLQELRVVLRSTAEADLNQNRGHLSAALAKLSTVDVRSLVLQTFVDVKKARLYDRMSEYSSGQALYEALKDRWKSGRVLDAAAEAQVLIQEAWLAHRQNNEARRDRALDQVELAMRRGRIDDYSYAEYLYFNGLRERRLAFKHLAIGDKGKARRHSQNALDNLKEALFYQIRLQNYDRVQAAAYNIANTLNQLGNEVLKGENVFDIGHDDDEIKDWLELTLWIADTYKVGGDTALAHITYASFLRKRTRSYEAARQHVAKALRKLRKTGNRYERGLAYRQCVHLHKLRGAEAKACLAYKRAVDDFEATQQLQQVTSMKSTFPEYEKVRKPKSP